jgi:hypothetical protein
VCSIVFGIVYCSVKIELCNHQNVFLHCEDIDLGNVELSIVIFLYNSSRILIVVVIDECGLSRF